MSQIHCTHSPGHLHGVLGEIDDPVDQVEGAKRKWEEDARVLVDDAGAGQNVVGRHGRALLQEGLGIDRRVGEGLCRSIKQRRRIHSFFEHTAGVHLQEREREHTEYIRNKQKLFKHTQLAAYGHMLDYGHVVDASSVTLLALARVAFSNSCPVITHSSGQERIIIIWRWNPSRYLLYETDYVLEEGKLISLLLPLQLQLCWPLTSRFKSI